MLNLIYSFFAKIFHKQKVQVEEKPSPVVVETPVEKPNLPVKIIIDWNDWCRRAIDVSREFEGGDWANITGNFDGAYLTCGALGFTWKYNNQPPMILEFISKHGMDRMKQLMPFYAEIYAKAARLGENQGASIVSAWSKGGSVQGDVKKELISFWTSPEMIDQQIKMAWKMMGEFAKKKCLEAQEFYSLNDPEFAHFAYYFDQAVLNGQGNTPLFSEAKEVLLPSIWEWMAVAVGYTIKDLRRNKEIWQKQVEKATPIQIDFLKMAYKRALRSREQFMPVTMNRRGTLALGVGYVNGEPRIYDWKK